MVALDQRESLRDMLGAAGKTDDDDALRTFKRAGAAALSPYASALLWALRLGSGDVVLVRPPRSARDRGGYAVLQGCISAPAWRAFVALRTLTSARSRPHSGRRIPSTTDRAARACAAILERFHGRPSELDLIQFWTEIVPLFTSTVGGAGQPSEIPDWLTAATARDVGGS